MIFLAVLHAIDYKILITILLLFLSQMYNIRNSLLLLLSLWYSISQLILETNIFIHIYKLLTLSTKISPVVRLMSNLLLAGLSGSMPWPVKKYTMFCGRSLSPSVAVTYLYYVVVRGVWSICMCMCVGNKWRNRDVRFNEFIKIVFSYMGAYSGYI